MDALYSFALRIAVMSVLCVLAESLIPQGRLKKTVQLCVGVLFVLAIASPIAGCVQQDIPEFSIMAEDMQSGVMELPTYEELLRGYYGDSVAID